MLEFHEVYQFVEDVLEGWREVDSAQTTAWTLSHVHGVHGVKDRDSRIVCVHVQRLQVHEESDPVSVSDVRPGESSHAFRFLFEAAQDPPLG